MSPTTRSRSRPPPKLKDHARQGNASNGVELIHQRHLTDLAAIEDYGGAAGAVTPDAMPAKAPHRRHSRRQSAVGVAS